MAPQASANDVLAAKVRGLFSNRCFACHGPDAAQRAGGFRLDDRDSFLAEADSGIAPVIPEDPEASELFRRLQADDFERMPPPEHGPPLSAPEMELIRDWIKAGASLSPHWSFALPDRPALPTADDSTFPNWNTHAIDRFVLQRMREQGFTPADPADRRTLIRRLSLDLIGLPPSPADVLRFLEDPSPNAYERAVDRILASPKFGEHWARKWLDLARYADSAGYADDPARTIWAYRDWVIDALNHNMPVDEFTIKQLAGDLLPEPSQADLIATAFHRNTMTNNEGGTNNEEFRNVAIVDRVNTTMAVWMGVTMACAQCHTHKYDPFTQEEYFQLFAILNQTKDADLRDESPILTVYSREQQERLAQLKERRSALTTQLDSVPDRARQEARRWLQQLTPIQWQTAAIDTTELGKGQPAFRQLDDGSLRVSDLSAVDSVSKQSDISLTIDLAEWGAGPIQALAVQTVPRADLPGGGAGLANGNFVLTNIEAYLEAKSSVPTQARFVRIELPGKNKILSLAEVQVYSRGSNVALEGKASQSSEAYEGAAARAVDGNEDGKYEAGSTTHTEKSQDPWWELDLTQDLPINAVAILNRTDNELQSRIVGARLQLLDENRQVLFEERIEAAEDRYDIAVSNSRKLAFQSAFADYSQSDFPPSATVDADAKSGWAVGGEIKESHTLTLVPKEPPVLSEPMRLRLKLAFRSPHERHILGSFRIQVSDTQSARQWSLLPPRFQRWLRRDDPTDTEETNAEFERFFSRNLADSTEHVRQELDSVNREIAANKPVTTVPIMQELARKDQRKTFIQLRGNYKSLGQQVTPGTPAVFHPIQPDPHSGAIDRMSLARWLVDPQNPMTARVWVNRTWESLFGRGIVRTSEEFGAQGELPSHPRLLDWLATEFVANEWDFKQLLRTLVTSQTYRQSSRVSDEKLARDKDNVWLSRGPRVRLSAEMVRDQALATAGLLSHRTGGPPVQPPQPDMGLKAAFGSATDWKTSTGADRYRRGLYTNWRRSNPYPSMATFDAPSREVCTLQRDATNTPLQALVTLNDPVFVEAAQALARRAVLHKQPHDDDSIRARIALIFELATNRPPIESEIDTLATLFHDAQSYLAPLPEKAISLAVPAGGQLPPDTDAIELAAYTCVCNVVLNLDEVLMKR